ncbi:MAG: transglutaminase domain-containing protein [Candidatus Methanofastidiosia archaeon]|jgi:hypothetical protein
MKKILFAVLIAVSLVASYYTYTMEQSEIEYKNSVLQDKKGIEDDITQVDTSINGTRDKIAGIEPLIESENKEQSQLQSQINDLQEKETQLDQEIEFLRDLGKKDPRVLITVDDPVVLAKVKEVTRLCKTTEEKQQAIFEYVRKEIEYVTEGNPKKYSYPRSFLRHKYDFWQLPSETIQWRKGDCEDVSILLCTMMRAAGVSPDNVRVVVGLLRTEEGEILGGHAWIEFKKGDTWFALESTCPTCNYIEKSLYYGILNPKVWGWFNDTEVHEEKSSSEESEWILV